MCVQCVSATLIMCMLVCDKPAHIGISLYVHRCTSKKPSLSHVLAGDIFNDPLFRRATEVS